MGLPVLAVVALVAILVAGYFVGTSRWQADPLYRYFGSTTAPVATVTLAQLPPNIDIG